MRWGTGLTVGCVLAVTPVVAHADRDAPANVISVGYLRTWVFGEASVTSHGAELTYMHYPVAKHNFAWSALGQVESYGGAFRAALGGQVVFGFFGVEAALARRGGDGVHGATYGVHVAPYASIGFLHLSLRFVAPIAGTDRYPPEVGLTLGLKGFAPLDQMPELIDLRLPSGRPLRDAAGRAHLPAVTLGDAAVTVGAPSRGEDRLAAARRWLADARLEAAAVVAFERLAEELAALGPDDARVAEARLAAEDERRHTAACLALASAFAGVPLALTALPPMPPRPLTISALAVEAFRDGCCGEGAAAAAAHDEARQTSDPAVRAVLETIAVEEGRHAAYAWQIVVDCLARAPADVRSALASEALADCGPSEAVRRGAQHRLRALLAGRPLPCAHAPRMVGG